MSLETRVINTIKKNIETELEVTMESKLEDELEVDSFSLLMIVAGLEDEFSISIEAAEFDEIKTVADVVEKLKINYPEIAEE